MRVLFRFSLALFVISAVSGFAAAVTDVFHQHDGATSASLTIDDPVGKAKEINRRSEAKVLVVNDLIAGEIGLLDAARWFGEMDQHQAARRVDPRIHHPSASVNESICHEVLSYVKIELQALSSSQAMSRLRELKNELKAHLLANGGQVDFSKKS